MMWRLVVLGVIFEIVLLVAIAVPLNVWFYRNPSLDTQIVTMFGPNWRGLFRYLAIWATLTALYLLALRTLRGARDARVVPAILGFAVLFSVTLLAAYPATSADVFHYVMEARIAFIHGGNPLTTPPSAYPNDPFLAFASWPDSPAPYGPLWILATWIPLTIGGGAVIPTLVAFKALSTVFALLASIVILAAVRRRWPERAAQAALAFSWSPLVLWSAAVDGHNDTVMVAFAVAGIALINERRHVIGFAILLLAAAVKAPALLLVPVALAWSVRSGDRPSLRGPLLGLVAGVAMVALLYAPFWDGIVTIAGTAGESSYFTASMATVFKGLSTEALGSATGAVATTLLFRTLFAAGYVAILWAVWTKRMSLLTAACWTMLIYLAIGAFWFMPWYATWPLALAALSSTPKAIIPALVLGGTSMLNHAVFGFGSAVTGASPASLPIETLAAMVIWTAPLAVAAVLMFGNRFSRAGKTTGVGRKVQPASGLTSPPGP